MNSPKCVMIKLGGNKKHVKHVKKHVEYVKTCIYYEIRGEISKGRGKKCSVLAKTGRNSKLTVND